MIYFKSVSQIEQLSRELGECVTGSRLDTLLANYQFKDEKMISTKWKRIHNAFVNQHNIYNQKIIDIKQRKITEIRIFYDDQTWETFLPKK